MVTFLSVSDVVELHNEQVELFGGSHGLRDMGLLESAVAMPQAGFGGEYLHADSFEMAAADLFHLALNHPFVDANKRTALSAALTFLRINGVRLHVPEDELYELVVAAAQGQVEKPQIVAFFRGHAQPANP